MTLTRKALCVVYAATGLLALVGTWGNNVRYLDLGFLGANVRFWADTLANPASRSITVDILFLALAVTIWMVLEARRLAMRGVWMYVLFSLVVAVSVAFPAFLVHRERTLAKREPATAAGELRTLDVAGLALLGIAFTLYAAATLTR
jgi:hypothetical protein